MELDKVIYDERAIKKAMSRHSINLPLVYFKRTTSTNLIAHKSKRVNELIVAKLQTDGRGRKDRKFVSNMGGIYFSYCFCPKMKPADASVSVLLCGIAVIRALKKFDLHDAKLKWPNDIYVGKKKICGILSSLTTTFDTIEKIVLGVGLNVDNEIEKQVSKATNLKILYNRNFDKAEILCTIISCIDEVFKCFYQNGFETLRMEYLKNCNFIGKEVEIIENKTYHAIAREIDNRGVLIVETENGLEKVVTGDVTIVSNQQS